MIRKQLQVQSTKKLMRVFHTRNWYIYKLSFICQKKKTDKNNSNQFNRDLQVEQLFSV